MALGSEKRRGFCSRLFGYVVLCVFQLVLNSSVTLFGPFYPQVAAAKGIPLIVVGVFFAVFPLCVFSLSFCVPSILRRCGSRIPIALGLMITGGSMFGFLYLENMSGDEFILYSIALRITHAIGCSLANASIFLTMLECQTSDLVTEISIFETVGGLGTMIGPLLGATLYSQGGFPLPFEAMGTACLALLLTVPFVPASTSFMQEEQLHYTRFLAGCPGFVWCFLVSALVSTACVGALEPVLAHHLRSFGLSMEGVGGSFMITSAVYALSAPMVGGVSLVLGRPLICVIGLGVMAGSFLMIGPTPLHDINLPSTLPIVLTGVGLLGLGSGACMLSVVPELTEFARRTNGSPAAARNIAYLAYNLGEVVGPIMMVLLMHVCDDSMPWTGSTFALIVAVVAVVIAIGFACGGGCCLHTEHVQWCWRPVSRFGSFAYPPSLFEISSRLSIDSDKYPEWRTHDAATADSDDDLLCRVRSPYRMPIPSAQVPPSLRIGGGQTNNSAQAREERLLHFDD